MSEETGDVARDSEGRCLTCYGTGEAVTDGGPGACPDCFGEGVPAGGGAKMEWRLRSLERAYQRTQGAARETEGDVLWLVNELRRHRGSLVRILARCQDAEASDLTAKAVALEANEVLALYEVVAEGAAGSDAVEPGSQKKGDSSRS